MGGYGFSWNYFTGRLHSTKEIIFFLENIDNIENILNNNPYELINCIFGDIFEYTVIEDSKIFLKNINKNINKIILEISSRKIMYYNNIPLNHYYSSLYYGNIAKYNLIFKTLTDEEIEEDLCYIKKLCKNIFNENIEIHVIPHLNLKTKLDNDYIFERNNLVILLENLCNKYEIKIHNIGKFLENNGEYFLEDCMPDSYHYDNNTFPIVKNFLIDKICN